MNGILLSIPLFITIIIMWYVVLKYMNSSQAKKPGKVEWLKRNGPVILAIAISISALYVSYDANQISKQILYGSEHGDEIFSKTIKDNVCVNTLIYSPVNKFGDIRSEIIRIALRNNMPKRIKDVKIVVMAPDNTTIQNITHTLHYELRTVRYLDNYSKFVFEDNIPKNTTIVLGFNLTWNNTIVSSEIIKHGDINFLYYAEDIPIIKIDNETARTEEEFEIFRNKDFKICRPLKIYV